MKALIHPGLYADGRGLYLQVQGPTRKSWIYRYAYRGRTRDMGLGPYPEVSLSDARKLRDAAQVQRNEGVDPIEARRAQKGPQGRLMTFREAAELHIQAMLPSWSSKTTEQHWRSSLKNYA